MSGNDADQVVKLPPLVPDDAPAAAKLQKPEEAREDDTLAARVKGDADAVLEDSRTHVSAASPPKHM